MAIIGCGYVGTAVARFWSQAGHQVTATTTRQEKVTTLQSIAQRVVVLRGNDEDALREVVNQQDMVLLSVGAADSNVYRETYLETAKNIVKALKQSLSVQQLIYTGSYAVLGDKDGAWTDETSPVAPANENGQILWETEQVLLAAQNEQLKVCILRLAGIYGKGRELIKIFGALAGTTRPKKGEDFTNWIHLDDIVGGLECARLKQLDGIYNLTCDEPLTARELMDRLFELHGLPSVSWDASTPPIRPYNSRLSNQKIKAVGFQLIHPEILF
ncbi:MAG: SDR family oxidoreductase [Brasilonema sp.]